MMSRRLRAAGSSPWSGRVSRRHADNWPTTPTTSLGTLAAWRPRCCGSSSPAHRLAVSRSQAWLMGVKSSRRDRPNTARSHTSLRRSSSGVVVARCTATTGRSAVTRVLTPASVRSCKPSSSSSCTRSASPLKITKWSALTGSATHAHRRKSGAGSCLRTAFRRARRSSARGGHFRRSAYGARFFRPAADGWYPACERRPAAPVLVDGAFPFPGRPVPPWPAAIPGEPFASPSGRGIIRLASDARIGRCPYCGRTFRRRLDGALVSHKVAGGHCEGSGQPPAEDAAAASWLPVLARLTPHGLRHGHQTWMEEAGISDLLRSERMGHEVPGMRGVYGHVSPAMRAGLQAMLQDRWETSLRERARLSARSIVPALDALLAAQREPAAKIRSHLAPRIGHDQRRRP